MIRGSALASGAFAGLRAGDAGEFCLELEVYDAAALPGGDGPDLLYCEGIDILAIGTVARRPDEAGRGAVLDTDGMRLGIAGREPLPPVDRVRLLGHLTVREPDGLEAGWARSWTVRTVERCRVHSIDAAGRMERTVTDLAAVPTAADREAGSLYVVRLSALPRRMKVGLGLTDALRGE